MRKLIALFTFIMNVLLLSGVSQGAYNPLHSFGTDGEGAWPSAGLVYTNGSLYGMTPYGGVSNCGTFFSVDTNSGSAVVLYRFSEETGRIPLGGLRHYDGRFYGMTSRGGTNDLGVLFSIEEDGTDYMLEHTFGEHDGSNGSFPWGGLTEYNGLLYGMTYRGGVSNMGVVFSFNPVNQAFSNLHSFVGGTGDGKYPQGNLTVVDGRLYGMTPQGGSEGCGIVFGIDPDGSNFETLWEFTGLWDGCNPSGSLLADGDLLYGMSRPGNGNAGTVWSVNRLTGHFSLLRSFTGEADDGADPYGSLIKQGSGLYGMTRFGGTNSQGIIFRLGGAYDILHHFANGGEPYGDLLAVGDKLYGMAFNEGAHFQGSVFELGMPMDSDPEAWCAMTWIEDDEMGTTLLGDSNQRIAYVQHNSNAVPDAAYIGYGLTQDEDDDTWTWLPMTQRPGFYGDDNNLEYTGTLGQATATGTYYVAAKFVKGIHVYYTKASFNDWGNWDTPLYGGQTWTVDPLAAPTALSGSYATDSNTVMLSCTGDGTHWVNVFRKQGEAPVMVPPVEGTAYTPGVDYPDQGLCVYAGAAGSFVDTNVTSNTTYRYAFYTENWSFYSAAALKNVVTDEYDPNGDDNEDGIPNWWELQYFGSTTGVVAGVDSDGDGMLDTQEYVAATDPTNGVDCLAMASAFTPGVGGTEYGANMLVNSGFESGTGSWTFEGNSKVEAWASRTGNNGAILSGQWVSNTNYATIRQQVAATPGQEYRAGGYFKRESQWTLPTALKLVFLDASQSQLAATTNSLTALSAGTWHEVLISATAPAGAAYAQVIAEATEIENWDSDGTFFVDDMMLQTVTTQDGDTFSLTWTMKTNRIYWVDYSASLVPIDWVSLATNLSVASEQPYTVIDTNVQQIETRKYRVGVRIP
jgi:uncharacterized repeat protein (TIGR03803 family)